MKNTFKLIFLVFGILLVQSCANNNSDEAEYIALEKIVETDVSEENINKLLHAYNSYISTNKDKKELINPILEKALAISEQYKQESIGIYLNALLRDNLGDDQKTAEYLLKLGDVLKIQNKKEASDVIFGSFVQKFPNDPKSAEISANLGGILPIQIIDQLAIDRLENPDQYGINSVASFKYVDACEAYALANPTDQKSPELLFDAAEMAKLLKTNNKALNIYDWLIESYPNYKKTPSALFIKAFILENEMNNIELAKAAYELFLEKYPDNDFADDARFSLENLGKSPEDVLKMIEANKK